MEIKAFKALRFDSQLTGDASLCISPPYDVIDDIQQEKLYAQSPYNIVRIIKGKTAPTDNDTDNQYTRARKYFNDWIEKGALKADSDEAIYAYVQNFNIKGESFRRSGFVALGKLKDFGAGVQPHEKTLSGPKADRLKLTRATAAQFGQIFMLYDDAKKIADKIITKAESQKQSLIDYLDDDNVRHRLFAIESAEDIIAITRMMADKRAIIADGHHRYETALNYWRETNNPAAEYCMMTFVNMRNEGLVILPTHRLVANLDDFDFDTLLAEMSMHGYFDIVAYPFADKDDKLSARQKIFDHMKKDFENGKNAFGLYAANGAFYTATLKNTASMDSVGTSLGRTGKSLDVNILHLLILEKMLGIGEKQLAGQNNIEYIKDIGDAIDKSVKKVDSGQSQAVFFMNPTRIEQVKSVAEANEKMPQKSTFFYPKIFTGLAINKL